LELKPISIVLSMALLMGHCGIVSARPGAVCVRQDERQDAWDSALDEYASICDKCLTLKDRIRDGEDVLPGELEGLLTQLQSLRGTLSAASGEMTSDQRSRYLYIRRRYSGGLRSRKSISLAEVVRPEPEAGAEEGSPAERPSCLAEAGKVGNLPAGDFVVKGIGEVQGDYPKVSVLALAGVYPMTSYGGMVQLTWRKVGGYVSLRSSFGGSQDEAYECKSDGTTGDGYIWASGETSLSRLSVTAGAVWNASNWVHPFVGVGYGQRGLWWEDTEGEWTKVGDKSLSGLSAEVGMVLSYKMICLAVGCTALPMDSYADVFVGIGVRF